MVRKRNQAKVDLAGMLGPIPQHSGGGINSSTVISVVKEDGNATAMSALPARHLLCRS
jgi:hypothetical protein